MLSNANALTWSRRKSIKPEDLEDAIQEAEVSALCGKPRRIDNIIRTTARSEQSRKRREHRWHAINVSTVVDETPFYTLRDWCKANGTLDLLAVDTPKPRVMRIYLCAIFMLLSSLPAFADDSLSRLQRLATQAEEASARYLELSNATNDVEKAEAYLRKFESFFERAVELTNKIMEAKLNGLKIGNKPPKPSGMQFRVKARLSHSVPMPHSHQQLLIDKVKVNGMSIGLNNEALIDMTIGEKVTASIHGGCYSPKTKLWSWRCGGDGSTKVQPKSFSVTAPALNEENGENKGTVTATFIPVD